jgi:hypothetical protein
VSRRPLALVAVVLAAALSAGCADDVAPAATVGKDIVITHDELMAEVEEWVKSPTLVKELEVPEAEGAGPGSYSTSLVDLVLTNRIQFDVHHQQLEELGLSVPDEALASIRNELVRDAATTLAVAGELDREFFDQLVMAVAERTTVGQAMDAEAYQTWLAEALADVEINSRYGAWDAAARVVLPPTGPRPAPGRDLLVTP